MSSKILTLALAGTVAAIGLNFPARAAGPLPEPIRVGVDADKPLRPSELVSLNFVNVEVEAVSRAMAAISGRSLVIDPRVKGAMTLVSDRPVSAASAIGQYQASLRLLGYSLVDTGAMFKVLPEADAKIQSSSVSQAGQPLQGGPSGGQVVTRIVKLNYESANNLLAVLRPLISPNNTINANPGNNSLVITDYADNLARLMKIIATLDVQNTGDVEIVQLNHSIASDVVGMLSRLMDNSQQAPGGAADPGSKTVIFADPRSNSVVLRTPNPERLALAKTLIARLDKPSAGSNGDSGNIYVVYLKNADATKLASTLRAAMGAGSSGATSNSSVSASSPATSMGPPPPSGASAQANAPLTQTASTTGGQIQADAATNSLIISAPEPQYRQLRAVIDKLDARRAQVYVESLIAEVSADKAAEFGIQWQGGVGKSGDSNIGVLGTNFGSGSGNIIALAAGAANGTVAPPAGFNFGVAHNFGGVYTLGFLAHFLESKADANILSTPNLLTLDNEEAKIVIGQNVPFVTGQYTANNSGGNGTVNPFQTIERKDVGLTLRVKPQISENGTVKLSVFQEVSSVAPTSSANSGGLVTNKRSIESNVIVDDGSIVVLGGLLQDEYSGNQDKVPGAGDIPILGALFKNESRSRKKTNLMVFLRPVVVRDSASSDNLTIERYQAMRAMQEAVLPKPAQAEAVLQNTPGALPLAPATRVPLSIFSNNETPALPGPKKP